MKLPREQRLKELGIAPAWRLRGRSAPATPACADGADGADRRGRILQMDWTQLREAVANCTACELYKTRTQGVLGVGDPHADWLIVGEAPGADEDAQGEPFVGQAGRLLDAMLSAFGLTTDRVYLASALPRHLPGADWDAIALSGFGAAVARHVALVEPKRLMVFGQTVLPLLSHDPPHGPADLREFNHEGGNVPMLACRSLAALLEQPRWKARVWQAWLELTG